MRRRVRVTPLGQSPYLEQRPNSFAQLFYFIGILSFFGGLFGGAYLMLQQYQQHGWELIIRSGWARHFNVSNPLWGSIRCLFDESCRRALEQVGISPQFVFPLGGGALGILILGMGVSATTTKAHAKAKGIARWAKQKDLKHLKRGRQSGYFGYLNDGGSEEITPKSAKKLKPIPFPETIRNGHVAVIGGPGAGKTTSFFLPNLLCDARDGNTAVVFDFKFPDPKGLGECINYFHHFGRNVYAFTPFEEASMTLPLLRGGETQEGAIRIAEMLVPKGQKEGSDEFYRHLDRALLSALIYAITNDPKRQPASPGKLFQLILRGAPGVNQYIQQHPREEVRSWSGMMISNLVGMDRARVAGLFNGLISRFILFNNPRLDMATTNFKEGQIDLKRVFSEPSLLYIGIPQNYIQGGRGQVLLQLVKRLLDSTILSVSHENGGKLPVHTAIYLDEFPSFGELPHMTEMLATMRSKRVSYLLSFQDHSQGYAVYGKDTFDAMFGVIQTIVAYPSRLTSIDRRWLTEFIGNASSIERSLSEGGQVTMLGLFERRAHETLREVERPLITSDEMQVFPAEETIVLSPGAPPIRSVMPFIFSDGKIKELIRHPFSKERQKCLKIDPLKLLLAIILKGGGKPLPEVLGDPEGQAEKELFAYWVERTLRSFPHAERTDEGVQLSIGGRVNQTFFEAWASRDWLMRQGGKVILTPKGLKELSKESISQLNWLINHPKVAEFIRRHRDKISGLAKHDSSGELGYLQGTTLFVKPVASDELSGEELVTVNQGGETWHAIKLRVMPEF